jgi:hypothetical protein
VDGCDVTIMLTYHGPRTAFAADDDRCYGGIAASLDDGSFEKLLFVRTHPLGVVDVYCVLNDREEVLSHEMAHIFGCQLDIATYSINDFKVRYKNNTVPKVPPKGDQHGLRDCPSDDDADCWHTIMAYPSKREKGRRSIGYFSCDGEMIDGKSIGYKASNSTDGYGADNCSIISKNIEMVSNLGTPNPFVAKRRPAPYKP